MMSLEVADLELRLDRKYLQQQQSTNAAAPGPAAPSSKNASVEYQNQKSTKSLITKMPTAKTVQIDITNDKVAKRSV